MFAILVSNTAIGAVTAQIDNPDTEVIVPDAGIAERWGILLEIARTLLITAAFAIQMDIGQPLVEVE